MNIKLNVYKFLLKNSYGSKSVLDEYLDKDSLDKFCKLGYVKRGFDGRSDERFMLTHFGKKQIKTCYNSTKKLDQLTRLCDSLGI